MLGDAHKTQCRPTALPAAATGKCNLRGKAFRVLLIVFLAMYAANYLLRPRVLGSRIGVEYLNVASVQSPPAFRLIPREFRPIPTSLTAIEPRDVVELSHLINTRLPIQRPSLSAMQHCLRVANAEVFGSKPPFAMYGPPDHLLKILCNASFAQDKLGIHGAERLFVKAEYGIHIGVKGVDCQPNELGDPHFCHLISVLGEQGIRLEQRFTTHSGYQDSLEAVLQQACAEYTPRHEPEFFTCAMAFYLKPPFVWEGKNEPCALSEIVEQLCDAEAGYGACEGTHVLQALAIAIRLDMQTPFLPVRTRRKAYSRLQQTSSLLELNQHVNGSWCNRVAISNSSRVQPGRYNSLNTTSHHLEWISLVPPDLRPRAPAVRNAIRFCIHELLHGSTDSLTEDYVLAASHALKALAAFASPKNDCPIESPEGGDTAN